MTVTEFSKPGDAEILRSSVAVSHSLGGIDNLHLPILNKDVNNIYKKKN
jgi:hypothetical protein